MLTPCEALRAGNNAAAENSAPSPPQLPPSHAKPAALDSAAECPASSLQQLFVNDAQWIRRVAANVEKRWHALWLRSLEWQRMLEQLLQGSRGIWETGGDFCFGYEPKTKQPRLSCEWDGGSSTASDRTMEIGSNCHNCTVEPRAENQLTPIALPPTESVPPERLESCVTVGQTAITDLKLARKGRRRFEVFNDVGYSSESSPQVSSEDCIRIYSYSPELAESVFQEHRDDLARDGIDECGTGIIDLYKVADEEEYEKGAYEASPLILTNVSNVDFYTMTRLEEAPFSDRNRDDVAGAAGRLDDEMMGFAALEQLAGDVEVCATGVDVKSEQVWRCLQSCEVAPLISATDDETEEDASVAGGNKGRVDSSCDANGEYTTNNESEELGDESDGAAPSRHYSRGSSSQGRDGSRSMSLLSKFGTGFVETIVQVGLALSEDDAAAPRGVLCQGLRKKRSHQRRSSVIELGPCGALQLCPHSTSGMARNLMTHTSTVKAHVRPRSSSISSKICLFSRSPILAHVEEQNSVSDQERDDNKDPPYLSEPCFTYSEQTAREDQMKKLLDFGDDYWPFIGSPSDSSSLSGQPRNLPRRSPHKAHPATNCGGTTEFDSDSDIQEHQRLLGQSTRSYIFIRNSLHKDCHLWQGCVSGASIEKVTQVYGAGGYLPDQPALVEDYTHPAPQ
ncbi:hypothetical protein HPB49_012150 [Dermacentor silvarum]|uniref:Uncharacterized protein n=1 Tax=Dermacentor silvarum TaxID=543639 RepID=A0ACB8DZJ9_DERSI|nr:hypothetical protein HPB49_012150 [Dermacentor silvarum]